MEVRISDPADVHNGCQPGDFCQNVYKTSFFRFLTYKKYGVSDYTRSGVKMPIGKI